MSIAAVLCLLAAASLLAPAAEPASAQMVLRSFSDGVGTSKSALAELAGQLRSQCAGKPVRPKRMSLAAALAHVQAQLRRHAGPRALSGFARSAEARTAVGAAGAVFGAVGDGKPWAAIDAVLRVHQLDARAAGPLISLAGMVSAWGMPQEGLALLEAAAKLKTNGPAPMGIDYQAVASNNRGYALLLLGHPVQAEAYLRSAEKRAPELSEARLNLDAAQQCAWALLPGGSGGTPPVIADPPFWREDQPSDWTTDPSGEPIPVALGILDLSSGRPWTPVAIRLAETPSQGAGMRDYYNEVGEKINSQLASDAAKQGALSANVRDPNAQTARRREAVWLALETAHWQPQLRPLYEAFKSQLDALAPQISIGNGSGEGGALDPSGPYWDALRQCEGSEACFASVCTSQTAALHAKWKPQIAALDDADQRYEAAYWKYATGVAANLADPSDHERLLLEAEKTMLADRALVLGQVSLFVDTADGDVSQCTGGESAPPATAGLPAQSDSEPCPAELNKLPKVNIDKLFKFRITCEKVEFEVSSKGWLGAFGSVTYTRSTGRTAVFVGGQMGALGAKARTGAFLVAGPNGVEDGGMRVSESTKGPGAMNQTHTVNFAVAGVVPFSE